MIDILLGLQWGDEGKGKVVDYLGSNYDIVARYQGGPNAGHTIYRDGEKMVLHTIPSGIFHEETYNLIGNGLVIDPITLMKECQQIESKGVDVKSRLLISDRAHIIMPTHRVLDKASEMAKGKDKIGSTLRGIGPAYMDKTGRNGLRVGDLLSGAFEKKYKNLRAKHEDLLTKMKYEGDFAEYDEGFEEAIKYMQSLNIINGIEWLNNQLAEGKDVLAEGAQGALLDIDFGTYPYVTSSSTGAAGVMTGLGIPSKYIRDVIGITKIYTTRVGSGPFPTELHDEIGEKLSELGSEVGATTGRQRRCGWLDLVALQFACMINGVTKVCITKADVIEPLDSFSVCEEYTCKGKTINSLPFDLENKDLKPVYKEIEMWQDTVSKTKNDSDLPLEFREFISYLNQKLKTKVQYVSTGPDREDIIVLRS